VTAGNIISIIFLCLQPIAMWFAYWICKKMDKASKANEKWLARIGEDLCRMREIEKRIHDAHQELYARIRTTGRDYAYTTAHNIKVGDMIEQGKRITEVYDTGTSFKLVIFERVDGCES